MREQPKFSTDNNSESFEQPLTSGGKMLGGKKI